MAASRQPLGIEIRFASQLGDALGCNVGMALLLARMLEELLGHGLGMNPGGHVVVTFVSQYTDNFRGQNLVQYVDDRFPVRSVGTGNRAHLHVLARPSAELLNIGDEWMLCYYDRLCFHCFFPFYEYWFSSQQSLPRESLALICDCRTGTT